MIRCPLTLGTDVRLEETLDAASIREVWKSVYNCELAGIWNEIDELHRYTCNETELSFFYPEETFGNGALYAQLQNLEWYYIPHKWEHETAIEEIAPEARVLEVGCGRGDFIERLCNMKIDAHGIELNPAAVDAATAANRQVRCCSLESVAEDNPESFDVVCHFQVLEHVPNCNHFLTDCLRCLKPGGKLIFAVPNMDSFIKTVENFYLNMPPHHMTQWTIKTVQSVASIFPLKLVSHKFEPLPKYHVNFFVNQKLKRFPSNYPGGSLLRAMVWTLLQRSLQISILRSAIRGQTQFASFVKLAE